MDWNAYYEELYPTDTDTETDDSWVSSLKESVAETVGDWFNQEDEAAATTTTSTGITWEQLAPIATVVLAAVALFKLLER